MRTTAVADAVGLSYRQVDYLTRRTDAPPIPDVSDLGSGNRRYWHRHTVEQLALTAHLARSLPTGLHDPTKGTGTVCIPALFDMVRQACPDGITTQGWALWWGSDHFTIVDHPGDLADHLHDPDATTTATVVLRFDLTELLPPEADTHPPAEARPLAERHALAMAGADPGSFT